MKIHILQHDPFEGPAYIAEWAKAKGHAITYTKFFEAFAIPFPSDIDWLIIMGGPMNVNETEKYPWLCDEKDYIHQMIRLKKKVLGICLGSQLIASALGASVFRNKMDEVGWFPICKASKAKFGFLNEWPNEMLAFHWHGDTYSLPGGAIRIFSSEACDNQAFVINNHVFALQFHWEITPLSLQLMIDHLTDDLPNGKFVQSTEEFLKNDKYFKTANQHMQRLLNYIENS